MKTINLTVYPYLASLQLLKKFFKKIDKNRVYSNFGSLYNLCEIKVKKFLKLKKKDIIFTSSGFSSLLACLLYIKNKNKKKKYCIVPAFSFSASAHSIILSGLDPFFVDISKETLHPDVDILKKIPHYIIKNAACIMLVSPFGYLLSNDKINNISNKFKIPIIYDAADSFLNFKSVDNLNKNVFIACSFHPTKTLPANESGLIICDKTFKQEIRSLVNFGIMNSDRNIRQVSINGKFSEYDAAIFLANFRLINNIKKYVKKISLIYRNNFTTINSFKLFNNSLRDYISNKTFVISKNIFYANKLKKFFLHKKIFLYLPWGKRLICYEKPFKFYKRASLSVSENIIKTYFFLPNYYGISQKKILKICKILGSI